MTLALENVSKIVGSETHIDNVSLELAEGSFNVLLGPDARRQDDADAADGRPRPSDAGARPRRWPRRDRRAACASATWRWSTSSSSTTRR